MALHWHGHNRNGATWRCSSSAARWSGHGHSRGLVLLPTRGWDYSQEWMWHCAIPTGLVPWEQKKGASRRCMASFAVLGVLTCMVARGASCMPATLGISGKSATSSSGKYWVGLDWITGWWLYMATSELSQGCWVVRPQLACTSEWTSPGTRCFSAGEMDAQVWDTQT